MNYFLKKNFKEQIKWNISVTLKLDALKTLQKGKNAELIQIDDSGGNLSLLQNSCRCIKTNLFIFKYTWIKSSLCDPGFRRHLQHNFQNVSNAPNFINIKDFFFIFSVIKIMVGLKPILGSTWLKERLLMHCRTLSTHTHSHAGNLVLPVLLLVRF